jgi:hypothetical protein
MRMLLAAAALAVATVRAAAAADCLAPLHAEAGWACHADLSNGESADFCLEHTHTFGNHPATRFFKLNSTGLHVSTCTCGAKGKAPGADFGADKSMLCFDAKSDTLTSAKVSRRKITGQTFFGTSDVRSAFSCRPDPTCDVPPVVEPQLPALHGSVSLPQPPGGMRTVVAATGRVDVGYLGCTGFASEAPTLTVDVTPTVAGQVVYWIDYTTETTNGADVLVITPSGAVHCNDGGVAVPLEPGPHPVWVTSEVAGETVDAELVGVYDQD